MKNNYLNAKHKLAILTLLLGCIVSLAWVKPFAGDEKKSTETYSSLADTADVQVDFPEDSAKVVRFHAVASDTLSTTEKAGITFVGKDGTTQTFERYEDLPDSLKVKVDAVRRGADSLRIVYNGSEWNKKIERRKLSLKEEQGKMIVQLRKHIDSLSSYFDSQEWKEGFAAVELNIERIREQTDSLKARFDTTGWRDKFAAHRESYNMYFNSPEGKRARELLKQQLEANKASIAEWRDMAIQRDKIMQRHDDSIRAYLDSPEWKSKLEQLKRELKEVDTKAL